MRVLPILAVAVITPTSALAHARGGSDDDAGWTFALWLTLPLAASALLWSVGFIRRWRRSSGGKPLLRREALWFASAWIVLALAVLSPLHAAGERSFTMHMIEHEIIMLVAAPFFAIARPMPSLLWGLAQPWRSWVGGIAAGTSGFWRAISAPLAATGAQAAALWLWHAPSLFDLALWSDFWHAVQHICFFVTALLFWSAVLDVRRPVGLRALCLFATSMIGGALGALMSFSESPWYAPYAALGMTPQGLTATEDQQLAGILMWVPGGFVHAGAALALLAPFLRSPGPERAP